MLLAPQAWPAGGVVGAPPTQSGSVFIDPNTAQSNDGTQNLLPGGGKGCKPDWATFGKNTTAYKCEDPQTHQITTYAGTGCFSGGVGACGEVRFKPEDGGTPTNFPPPGPGFNVSLPTGGGMEGYNSVTNSKGTTLYQAPQGNGGPITAIQTGPDAVLQKKDVFVPNPGNGAPYLSSRSTFDPANPGTPVTTTNFANPGKYQGAPVPTDVVANGPPPTRTEYKVDTTNLGSPENGPPPRAYDKFAYDPVKGSKQGDPLETATYNHTTGVQAVSGTMKVQTPGTPDQPGPIITKGSPAGPDGPGCQLVAGTSNCQMANGVPILEKHPAIAEVRGDPIKGTPPGMADVHFDRSNTWGTPPNDKGKLGGGTSPLPLEEHVKIDKPGCVATAAAPCGQIEIQSVKRTDGATGVVNNDPLTGVVKDRTVTGALGDATKVGVTPPEGLLKSPGGVSGVGTLTITQGQPAGPGGNPPATPVSFTASPLDGQNGVANPKVNGIEIKSGTMTGTMTPDQKSISTRDMAAGSSYVTQEGVTMSNASLKEVRGQDGNITRTMTGDISSPAIGGAPPMQGNGTVTEVRRPNDTIASRGSDFTDNQGNHVVSNATFGAPPAGSPPGAVGPVLTAHSVTTDSNGVAVKTVDVANGTTTTVSTDPKTGTKTTDINDGTTTKTTVAEKDLGDGAGQTTTNKTDGTTTGADTKFADTGIQVHDDGKGGKTATGTAAAKNADYDMNEKATNSDACRIGTHISGDFSCSGTKTLVKASQVANQLSQAVGSTATQIAGQQAQMTAMQSGSQADTMRAAGKTQVLSGEIQVTTGAVNGVMGIVQLAKGMSHSGNADDITAAANRAKFDFNRKGDTSGNGKSSTQHGYLYIKGDQSGTRTIEGKITQNFELNEAASDYKTKFNEAQANDPRFANAKFAREEEARSRMKIAKGQMRKIANAAAAEQTTVGNEATASGIMQLATGIGQAAQGAMSIMAGKLLQEAADKLNTGPAPGEGNYAALPDFQQDNLGNTAQAPSQGTSISGDGKGPEVAAADDAAEKDKNIDLGRGFNPDANDKGLAKDGPPPGGFKGGSDPGGNGGGGGPSLGGSTSAAQAGGDADPAAKYAEMNRNANSYDSGGAFVGGGGGGGGGGDKGPDLSGLLAQFLPKKEDEKKDGILDFGGRDPAAEGPISLLDKNANIFERIHQTYQEKQTRKVVGVL